MSKPQMRFRTVDSCMVTALRYISYAAAGCLLIMALLATANVVYSKLFSRSIPSSTDWIAYLMIPVVYLSVAYVVLDRGLIAVDIISGRFPKWVKNIITALSYCVGAGLGLLISYRLFMQMLEYKSIHKMSSTSALSLPLWPFYCILCFGMVLLSISQLWVIVWLIITGRIEQAGVDSEAEEQEEESV